MSIILLIRHGDNDFIPKRLAGRTPGVHLNEKGRQQAEELAQRLKGLPIKAVYSSPLERAVETAEPIARLFDLPVLTRFRLTEVDYGDWQGKSFKQLQRFNLWKTVQNEPASVCFPNGETLADVQNRAVTEVRALGDLHEPQDIIACVTHGDVIRLVAAHYLNMQINDFQRLTISTASITALSIHEEDIRVLTMNQVLFFRLSQEA